MKGRQIRYEPEELVWIEARKEWPRRDLHTAFVNFWLRPEVTVMHLNALCKRKGWLTGRTGCFAKGHATHNKGVPMSAETRAKVMPTTFKKGRSPTEARNYQPIGTERTTDDGYIERKIHDGMPLQSRWRLLHLVRWEALHGPVPTGHALKCLDGDRQNTDPANWEAIPRALLPRLAGGRWNKLGYDQAEPEVRPALMAIAKLQHKAREAKA